MFVVSNIPPPFPNLVSNGLLLQVQRKFFSLQIVHPVGVSLSEIIPGTFVFEAQNDMKSQAQKKKKKGKAKSRRRMLESRENHSLNSPGVDERDSHKLQQGSDLLCSESQPETLEMFHYLFH